MKTSLFSRRWLGLAVAGLALVLIETVRAANTTIPFSEIGAKATADYQGDGLTVTATDWGARLHCVFQRLDGEATSEGLWLTSTVTNHPGERFRVRAVRVGRRTETSNIQLAEAGEVSVEGKTVRHRLPGLVEEYSVSMDGVRQDFVVMEKPTGDGQLEVRLAVSGARVEPAAYGAQLLLEQSGRKIAYSRMRATDATGKELAARIEVYKPSAFALSVVVNDAGAVYPVRIDPTFSDANWISMGGLPGTDGAVSAAVIDGPGNLYIGGSFTIVGNVIAKNIAKWDGSSWSALGPGVNGEVRAMAVSGGTLYAGGYFTTAGGTAAISIAQWNGSSWSALGLGMNNVVEALAVSGGTLYVGGDFTRAGGNAANYIAQWDGSSWSALGSGMAGGDYPYVFALAVSGGTLYAGGDFTTAGGTAATNIAQSLCECAGGVGRHVVCQRRFHDGGRQPG
ncbi:MAG: hypothetical protein NT167_29960 [Verrucomicrobia bacterium]|nr:hypothetical protein [Verrucomicrobiota bacterium]